MSMKITGAQELALPLEVVNTMSNYFAKGKKMKDQRNRKMEFSCNS